MRNPLKTLLAKFKDKPQHEPIQPGPDQLQLIKIWPDGTWTLLIGGRSVTQAQRDNIARGVILDSWRHECLLEFQAQYPGLSGGMLHSSPIPDSWLPSEKVIKDLAARRENDYNLTYVHYIVGQLTHLGHILP